MKTSLLSLVGNVALGGSLWAAGTGVVNPTVPVEPKPLNDVVATEAKPEAKPVEPPATQPEAAPCDSPKFGVCATPACGPQYWASADYLMWWLRGQPRSGPLLSTGPETDPFPGALDQPNTRVLHGDDVTTLGITSGLRARIGGWIDSEHHFGIELSGFFTERDSTNVAFGADGAGQPFLARPFINDRSGLPNVYFVAQNFTNPALAAFLTGSIDFQYRTRFWGYDVNGLLGLHEGNDSSVIGTLGYRALGLDESLTITERLQNLNPGGGLFFNGNPVAPGQTAIVADAFRTKNRFHGANAGLRCAKVVGRCFVDGYASVGLGVTHQQVNIEGNSLLVDAAGNVLANGSGGTLALNSNIGRYERSTFSVVPEIGLNLGYQLTSSITARVGYSFIYWTSVARPTRQLDFNLDPGQVPTDAAFGTPGTNTRPVLEMRSTDFWAQGINFGLEFKR